MSMLIRSQDKGKITNFNLVSDLVVSKSNKHWEILACYAYFAGSDCGYATLGEYSTEEKAIKVLDLIQKNYERRWEIFQMPQDSEV